jgi:hypothetical protein
VTVFVGFITATSSFEPDPQRETDLMACVKETFKRCTHSRLMHPHGFAVDIQFDALVPHFRDLVELIDRQEILDPVAQIIR